MRAQALGIALSWAPGRSAYVPLGHSAIDLPQAPARRRGDRGAARRCSTTRRVAKVSANAKHDQVVLERLGARVAGLASTRSLAAYLLDPGRRAYALDDIAIEHLGERRAPGTDGIAAADAAADPTSRAAGAEAELTLRLARPMRERLEAEGLGPIYESMELPLVAVLADMERAGVKVDTRAARRDEPRDGGAAAGADASRSTGSPRASSTSTRRCSCARCCSTGWG